MSRKMRWAMYISTADLSGNSLTTNPNAKTNFIVPEGYSVKEIGRLLRLPVGTVGSRLSRGREILKQQLGGDYETK